MAYPRSLIEMRLAAAEVKSATSSTVGSVFDATMDYAQAHPILTAVVGSVAGLSTAYFFREKLRRVSYRVRGIKGESARAGSSVVHDDRAWPTCQVLLYEAGNLWSTFIGCGVRVGDFLVTYTHVVQGVDKLVARTPRGYFLLNTAPVNSSRLADVTYFQLTPEEWSRMGTTSANKRPVSEQAAMRSQPVRVWSKEGYTQGVLAPLHMALMKMEYSGTTEPGFSGAPYMGGPNNSQVLGLHQGVQSGANVGYIWYAILCDIQQTFYASTEFDGESKKKKKPFRSGGDHGRHMDMARDHLGPKSGAAWGYNSIREQIDRIDAGDSGWATHDDQDFDWNADLAYDQMEAAQSEGVDEVIGTVEAFSQAELEAVKAMVEALILKRRTVTGQSDVPVVVDGGDSIVEVVKKACNTYTDLRVGALEKRVKDLEQCKMASAPLDLKSGKQKGPAAIVHPHKCMCGRSFKTPEGLKAHKVVKGCKEERAPAPFLGGKKPNHSSNNWRVRSNSAESSRPSPPARRSQPSLEDTLRKLADSLQHALKDIAGQRREPGPSSKV